MKALTIRQPHASLVAMGVKTIETRSWDTSYRGPLAIHAAKKRPRSYWSNFGTPQSGADPLLVAMFDEYRFDGLFDSWESSNGDGDWKHEWRGPLGAVVATCNLVDVIATYPHMAVEWPDQMPYGDFTPNRFAWVLDNIQQLSEPIPQCGYQGLWNWDDTKALAA